ncbi:MAG: sugar-binding domain-containing protein [Solibacillus sp.]
MDKSSFLDAGRKLMPEIEQIFRKRFRVLQAIEMYGPIGRRALAEQLQWTEREVRNETDVLSEQQLIVIQQKGMICSAQGYSILEQLKALFQEISGITVKEQQLAKLFNIERVIIIPGNVEEDASIKNVLGKEGAKIITQHAREKCNIAVTGGNSVAAIGDFLLPTTPLNSACFIAARGGMGDEMSFQANTVVAKFAHVCNATYRTLFLPEHLSTQAYQAMKSEPMIQEMMALYEEVDIVVHGIGAAQEMAIRRNSSPEEQQLLEEKGAVGEAFGYYFNEVGEIVHHIRTIGIQLEQVKKAQHIIAIAAGINKATAIQAYFKNATCQTTFITDERTANEIIAKIK